MNDNRKLNVDADSDSYSITEMGVIDEISTTVEGEHSCKVCETGVCMLCIPKKFFI